MKKRKRHQKIHIVTYYVEIVAISYVNKLTFNRHFRAKFNLFPLEWGIFQRKWYKNGNEMVTSVNSIEYSLKHV